MKKSAPSPGDPHSDGPPPPQPYSEQSALGGLIPGRNPPALIGYYLAVFSLIPMLGAPLGVAALFCGIAGLRKVRAHPEVRGKVHAWFAVICGGICGLGWSAAWILLFVAGGGRG